MSQDNLLPRAWSALDLAELRLLLAEVIGQPGQYDGANKNCIYLPLAGPSAKVVLHYKGSRLTKISRGPAFSAEQWANISNEVESSLMHGPLLVGREISFAGQPVSASWRGISSGVQILPPPEGAPRPQQLIAEHPFVLEFRLQEASRWQITNYRRIRTHERLSNLLNVLLTQPITLLPRREDHLWVAIHEPGQEQQISWAQNFYFANIGNAIQGEYTAPCQASIAELSSPTYYSTIGNDGHPLRVPQSLDEQLAQYLRLPRQQRERFDRAAYWMAMAGRQWNLSMSLSFTALVSAVEALTERGTQHRLLCPECNKSIAHESPGATERFRAFLERHSAGSLDKARRNAIYALRSGILHGSSLMTLDFDLAHGWDPPWWNERELHGDLWKVTKTALRNWLATESPLSSAVHSAA